MPINEKNSMGNPDNWYTLKLGESFENYGGSVYIRRVPGGWIYAERGSTWVNVATFIPFNNEFQPKGEI